jgi:TRIAP1/MDM35 family protein
MASSLSSECTPLKQTYDACFNAWFEGYLEPAVAASTPSTGPVKEPYSDWTKKKAAEYEEKCGKVWRAYRECVQVRRKCIFAC